MKLTPVLLATAITVGALTGCGQTTPSTAHPPSTTPPPTTTTTTTTVHATPPTEARLIAAAHEAQTIRFYNALGHQAAERAAAEQAAAEAAEAARRAAATTTTTTAPAPPPTTPPAPVEAQPATGICGGDLPPCWVVERESGGDPRIWNGSCYAPIGWAGKTSPCGGSTASGIYQFIRGTWNNYGGFLNAADAPVHVQVAKARELWAGGAGCGHWQACR